MQKQHRQTRFMFLKTSGQLLKFRKTSRTKQSKFLSNSIWLYTLSLAIKTRPRTQEESQDRHGDTNKVTMLAQGHLGTEGPMETFHLE